MSEQHTTQSSIAESRSRTEPLSLPSAIVAASAVLLVATVAGLGLLKFYCLAPDNYPGGLHPCVKDSIQSAVAIAGIVTVAAAAWGVVNELRKQQIARDQHVRAEHKGNELRADDLRWRRAQEARKLLQDIHNHPLASVAVQMMDWWPTTRSYRFPDTEKDQYELSWETIREAVADPKAATNSPKCHVVDAFDWFLFYLNQIEHAIASGLVCREDVLPTLKPYLDRLDVNSVRPAGGTEDSRLPLKHLIDEHSYSGIASLKARTKTLHLR